MKISQKSEILRYLQENGSITSFEAFKEFGATRLSGIIFNLREKGYIIESETRIRKNRYGNILHYAVYHYKGVKDEEI